VAVIVSNQIISKWNWTYYQSKPSAFATIQQAQYYPEDHPEAQIKADYPRNGSRAIIHMGPHKTGTTTIQRFTFHHKLILKEDGYELLEVTNKEDNLRSKRKKIIINSVNFATCFIDPQHEGRIRYPCDPDRLLHGLDLARKGSNVFISSEAFAKMDEEGVAMLENYLSHWSDVTIILFYRRYYEWLPSLFNHENKRWYRDESKWGENIVDFLEENSETYHSYYVWSLLQRLRRKFDEKNIILMDFHDKSTRGPEETLFCNIPNATEMCNAARSSKEENLNPSVNLDYFDLAYGAKKEGMVSMSGTKKTTKLLKAIEKYHNTNLTGAKFERVCASSTILERIWSMTLAADSKLNPRNNPDNYDEMRLDFEKSASTKLCKLDVAKTLNNPAWKNFFDAYNKVDHKT